MPLFWQPWLVKSINSPQDQSLRPKGGCHALRSGPEGFERWWNMAPLKHQSNISVWIGNHYHTHPYSSILCHFFGGKSVSYVLVKSRWNKSTTDRLAWSVMPAVWLRVGKTWGESDRKQQSTMKSAALPKILLFRLCWRKPLLFRKGAWTTEGRINHLVLEQRCLAAWAEGQIMIAIDYWLVVSTNPSEKWWSE